MISNAHHIVGALALAFCTWAVSLGAIAALQSQCDDSFVTLLGGTACSSVYRYWWFVVAFEFVVIAIAVAGVATNTFHDARIGIVGLFAVATLLYIEMTNNFLIARDNAVFSPSGSPRDRCLTMLAGSLMTATINCVVILVGGYYRPPEVAFVAKDPEIARPVVA